MVKVVEENEKAPVGKKTPKEEEKKENRYLVAHIDSVAGVVAASERDAVRAIAAVNGSGKYLVVDSDFVEVLAASHRVELKADTADGFFAEEQ